MAWQSGNSTFSNAVYLQTCLMRQTTNLMSIQNRYLTRLPLRSIGSLYSIY